MSFKDDEVDIERGEIKFHTFGTLKSLTQWVNTHEDGFPEWIKNVRSAYCRLNLPEKHRAAVILIKDKDNLGPARLGILDVGGATEEDVNYWSVWQDPDASSRGGQKKEETQGNGGKAYMYKLFNGPSYFMGVNNNIVNRIGFIGEHASLDRGNPGYIPSEKEAKNFKISDWEDLLIFELQKFGTNIAELPTEVKDIIFDRKSYTIVNGSEPRDWNQKDIKFFLKKISRQSQSVLALNQVRFYVLHNGRLLNEGKPLKLEEIEPHPKFKDPIIYEIPKIVLKKDGNQVNTTKSSSGIHKLGRIILYTSKENMSASYVTLKPRWVVTYKTQYEVVGQKTIPEIISAPGIHFIYAVVELDALSPDYVNLGRKRPNPGSLIDAVDQFLSEKIRDLAKEINELNKEELSKLFLDEIQKENKYLNEIKNRFLPKGGLLEVVDTEGDGEGSKNKKKVKPIKWGKDVHKIETQSYALKIGVSVPVNLKVLLKPSAKDLHDNPIPSPNWEWKSDNKNIIEIDNDGNCIPKSKGSCRIWVSIPKTSAISAPIEVEVWKIKEIILSPRNLEISTGSIKMITAQVTNDEGEKSADVILKWKHDAENERIVKISPRGYVFGNSVGKTNVFAESEVSCTNPCEVEIVKGENKEGKGSGVPQLLLTEKDIDPFTGEIRPSDPEAAALWQEPWDVQNNIWWLNLQSKDASFAYRNIKENPHLWRLFHAKILVDMMIQVHMQEEYNKKIQEKAYWSDHKYFYDRKYVELCQVMWEKLSQYVQFGMEEGND
ncbi:MAG: hypothetical protein JXC85_06220 [Candidatus Aenigmarchaeota archaeon]|nr:hypothetical protein [Candidatus Aenigmarchaeota archaeon]